MVKSRELFDKEEEEGKSVDCTLNVKPKTANAINRQHSFTWGLAYFVPV
jgi:hypothetical protein